MPPWRVGLKSWCDWTGQDWEKIRNVVGSGFRLLGPGENIYTMAASAVLRLVDSCNVDPRRVRYLALGTESSTDNSAGAIVVKGLVNAALAASRRPAISRNCEVPEFKHACLAGVYALKSALRFLASDGSGSLAIVVCADQALYDRGSSGEPTQGAGAVAILLSAKPAIASIDLRLAGSASDYRHLDFRKPLRNGAAMPGDDRLDTPVFNGKYSTNCYLDEIQRALEDLYRKRGLNPIAYLRCLPAAFLHRPYQRMPETGWGLAWLAGLTRGSRADRAELAAYCRVAHVAVNDVSAELNATPDVARLATRDRIHEEIFPRTLAVLRVFRETDVYEQQVMAPLHFGAATTAELGNLYSGALPAWVAAGLSDAAAARVPLAGQELLMIGYGSGDAAEAIPMRMVSGWEKAARRIRVAEAIQDAITLTRDQYEALRDHRPAGVRPARRRRGFMIDRVGTDSAESFQDLGVEYYRFVP